jgi:hypothetical protein
MTTAGRPDKKPPRTKITWSENMSLMRRQSLVKFDAPLCETIVDTPKPQGREVLVRIERCGLCHSDLHIQDGYADLGGGKKLDTTRGMTLPFTLGHEIAGVVDEVGPDAPKSLIGRKVRVLIMMALRCASSPTICPIRISWLRELTCCLVRSTFDLSGWLSSQTACN